LTAELAERGIKTDRRAVWTFLKAEGLSFKKNRSADGTVTTGYRPQTGTLESPSAQD
jgi:transposase